MDAQTQAAISALQGQVAQLAARLAMQSRAGAYAPNAQNPFVIAGPQDFYSYTQRVASLASGATAQLTFPIEADSFFYCNALSYTADIAGAALTESTNVLPLVNVVILDTGSGRQLMANAVPIPSIMGDGKRPFRLAKPRQFVATSQIVATLVNYSAGTTYDLWVTISGFKVYSQQAVATTGVIGT